MRVLSGIQPSGKLHLGNYFGAMKQHIQLQQENEAIYFIADYHALTTVRDAQALRQNIRDVALDYLALGLDPAKTIFFKQSDVPQVTELAWILSTITPLGLLERCHSYKDKIAHGISPHHGVFAYPVLMAADILIYQSELVPVGKDQKQHIEVARDIALKFNNIYADIFTLPQELMVADCEVVPGIDGQKMSKTYNNTIGMFEPENDIKRKVMSIVTDSKTVAEPKDPEQSNLFALYCLFATAEEKARMEQKFRTGGTGYGEVKKELFHKIMEYFAPFREKRRELEGDPGYVERILAEGGKKATEIAAATLKSAKQAIGVL
jgi:tryptophanyl-tRNA synthetase